MTKHCDQSREPSKFIFFASNPQRMWSGLHANRSAGRCHSEAGWQPSITGSNCRSRSWKVLALHDFSTGCSSLASLHLLPVNVAKIDHSFISQWINSAHQRVLVEAVVKAVRSLRSDYHGWRH